MRVTNDEARLFIYDIDIRAEKRFLSVNESRIHELCTDLLEARETIDKQTELIKEMREEINLTLRDFEKIDEVCKTANVMPFSLTKKKLCEIMEKTKEYAE